MIIKSLEAPSKLYQYVIFTLTGKTHPCFWFIYSYKAICYMSSEHAEKVAKTPNLTLCGRAIWFNVLTNLKDDKEQLYSCLISI